ncbi:MAG: metallophosphoesterase [Lachnospiraceae bacterium]|nr:metallophosphoesterase [Lachnospiraceae bacterium]
MPVLYILCAAVLLLVIWCHIETRLLKTVVYSFSSPKVPEDMEGKRIVLLSDLHCTMFGKGNKRLLKHIADAKPDMIMIAGDMINGDSKQYGYALELLKKLSGMGTKVYYSFGNHECRLDKAFWGEGEFDRYVRTCEPYCNILNNDHTAVGEKTCVYGLMLDLIQFGMSLKEPLTRPINDYLGAPDPDKFNIMIAHDPGYIRDYLKWGADLVLSGHLHGGIISLPLLGGLISPRFTFFPKPDKGLYIFDKSRAHVISAGIGWHAIPFRFLNRPEVVVTELHKAKDT